ncbi:restriction endonuclease subunit S [Acidithiobacillus sp.]
MNKVKPTASADDAEIERLDDEELAQLVKERANESTIPVSMDELSKPDDASDECRFRAEEKRAEYVTLTNLETGSNHRLWKTMGDIAEVVGGGTPKTTDPTNFEGGNIPWLTPADLSGYTEKYISHGARFITRKGLDGSSARILPPGSVLFTSRAPIGYVAIARNPIATNQGFKSFILKEGVLSEYVYWWLKGAKQTAESLASGTTFLELSGANAKKLPIPIVPLYQQKRIVAEIEKQFSRLDETVANLKRVKANLKRYKAAVLKAAVEGRLVETGAERARREGRSYETGAQLLQRILDTRRSQWKGKGKYKEPAAPDTTNLPDLPEGWTWASAEQLAAGEPHSLAIGPFGSNLKVHDYTDSGVPLVFVRNIRSASFGGADTFYVTEEKASELKAHRVDAGDLLITKMGDPPGDVCIYPMNRPPAVITADCIKLRLGRDSVSTRFCAYAIEFECVHNQILGITKGVAQLKVSLGRFSSIGLPLPPITEQHRIVAEVDRRLSLIRTTEAQVDANLHRAERLRQSILAQAFSGRLKLSEESVGEVA